MLSVIILGKKEALVDLGSKTNAKILSSYLGELDTVIWACKKTKALRGTVPLTIPIDRHSIFDKYKAKIWVDDDVQSFRRWSSLIANEPGFELKFCPGSENIRVDLLSRPDRTGLKSTHMVITKFGIEKVIDSENQKNSKVCS